MSASGLGERIHRAGPVPFSTFVEAALYDPESGFFATGHGAGRAGRDFVTSPEVGPLFGACIARALDRWWHDLGEPDPFVVMEAGAGTGRLCREVMRAVPECSPALRYVLVERSAVLREAQRELLTVEPFEHALGPSSPDLSDGGIPMPVQGTGPIVSALEELPALTVEGVVIANELLDNLAFDLVERTDDGWLEIRVGVSDAGVFYEVPVRASEEIVAWLEDLEVPTGARVPVQHAIETWIDDCATRLRRGVVLILDYAAELDELVRRGRPPEGVAGSAPGDGPPGILGRPPEGVAGSAPGDGPPGILGSGGWLRTYRAHERGGDPLEDPGSQDITTDVLLPTLRRDARRAGFTIASESSQAGWLRSLGIDDLVEEGRARWEAGAARGDLEALAGRSRITEGAALTDPDGLGGHTVVVLTKKL